MFRARQRMECIALLLTLALTAPAAFAGSGNEPGAHHPVSWDEFKRRCENPNGFENQHRLVNIKILCTNTEREFVQDAPGSVELATTRKVTTALIEDKFYVNPMEREYAMAQKPGHCPRYKEIEKTITVERGITCEEILNLKQDINDLCVDALNSAKGSTPKLIEVRDTGIRRDTCSSGGGK